MNDWSREENFFKLYRSLVLLWSPEEGYAFLGQIVERMGDFGEVRDELPVEIAGYNEQSNFCDTLQRY